MPRLPCCLLLLLAGGAAAAPDDDTGERLYQDCSSQNEFLKGYCGGYITGVIASLVNLQRYRQVPDSLLCLPVDVSKGELVDRVAARHLRRMGFRERVDKADEHISTATGHHWDLEIDQPNLKWENVAFCGLAEE